MYVMCIIYRINLLCNLFMHLIDVNSIVQL